MLKSCRNFVHEPGICYYKRRLMAKGITQDEADKEASKLYDSRKEAGGHCAKPKKRKKNIRKSVFGEDKRE